MCIIAIYENGKNKPTREILSRMILKNPDGVGVAYNSARGVKFVKGLKTASEVLNEYTNAERDGFEFFIFHARISTSGGVSAEKCHPFILSNNDDKLNKTQGFAKALCFHNGILHLPIEKGLNDTQTFVKNCLYPLYNGNKNALFNGAYDNLIEQAVQGSRFVILSKNTIKLYGDGWVKDDGVWYSNSGYKPYQYINGYTSGGSYIPVKYRLQSLYGDDDGWCL